MGDWPSLLSADKIKNGTQIPDVLMDNGRKFSYVSYI